MSEIQEFIELKNLADITMGQSPDSASCNTDESGLPFLQGCAEFGKQSPYTNVYCFPPLRISKPDSVLMSVRAPVGKMNWGDQSYCIGRGLASIKAKPNFADTKFLNYSLEQNVSFLHRRSQGSTFLAISANDVKIFPIPVISYEKQRKISSILGTIDRTIAHTEALIEKYQQIKAGLMHDLFTRGIGADGKLRPPRDQAPEMYRESSIGWIPKEWNLRKLVELADICSGVTLGSKRTSEQTISVPYLRVANVQDGYLDLSDVKEITVSRKTFDSLILQVGDVLMNEGGDFDKLGRGTIWRGEISPCIHQNHVFRVRTNSQTLNHLFLAYWSQSFYGKKYFVLNSKQSTNLASINSTQLKKFPVALPSLDEQVEIEKRIESINAKITLLDCEQIKLSNQKSGLMHDLLTGKVQVNIDSAEAVND